MKDIGGYIELDGRPSALHPDAIALNCGRACLEYLIDARGIKRIWLPDFLCDSVRELCGRKRVQTALYAIGENFEPVWDFAVEENEYLYLVDYYGQLTSDCVSWAHEISGGRLIVDEAMALFRDPWEGIDTLYTVRKFLGVPDGAYLCTDARLPRKLDVDQSLNHMAYVLGRVEQGPEAFFRSSKENNSRFAFEPMQLMSSLTRRLIGRIDTGSVIKARLRNWDALATVLNSFNELSLTRPASPFMYPFLVSDGPAVRKKMAERGIFIPTLWPDVVESDRAGEVARCFARDILPLPIDQRYGFADMAAIIRALREIGVLPRELEGRRIGILGGTRISCEIVRAAKALGLHTTVIDYYPPEKSPAKQISDAHALISVADSSAVASYAKEHSLDGLITGYTDSILGFYADACECSGLPCYGTRSQFETFTDKRLWKKLCREYGVPTAREYSAEILNSQDEDVSFPLLVKPAEGSGSRGVSVARDAIELIDAMARARSFSKIGEVVIEDYLEGPEVTVFWLFSEGERRVFLLGNRLVKHNQGNSLPLPAGYTFPASVLPRYLDEVAPRVKKMLASQDVRDGMMFMQCVVVDGLPYVYDIGYRLTGSLEYHITEAVAGYSPMDMLLRYAVTGKMAEDPLLWQRVEEGLYATCYNLSVLMRPGELGRFVGLNSLECDSVAAYVKAHIEGEVLPQEAVGELRQIALRVLGCVDDVHDLEGTVLTLQDAIRVESASGEDLTLPGLESDDFRGNILHR